jgi:hypothetical protein
MTLRKWILLGVSTLAITAAWAAAALADPEEINTTHCSTGTVTVLCLVLPSEPGVLWEQNVNGAWTFEGRLKAGTSASLNVEGGPDVQCKSGFGKGELDTTAELTLSLIGLSGVSEVKECAIINSAETKANCVIKEPVEIKGEGSFDLPENDGVLKPVPPSTVFAEVTIKSAAGKTCIFAKEKQKVTGEQLCESPLESETELTPEVELDAVTHFATCTEAGSSLLYAEKAAKLFVESEGFLAKGGEWALRTG